MRSPTLASAAVTLAPTATTTPQGSCPAMTGSALAGMPVPVRGRFFGRRYWCRSDPHMPEAFISSTTSPGPGVGSGKVMISTARSPGNTTPRMASSVCCLLRRNLSRFVASPYPEIRNQRRQRRPCEMTTEWTQLGSHTSPFYGRAIACGDFRRLDRSAKRGAERPSLHDKRPIVERVAPLGTEFTPSEVEGALGRDDGKTRNEG